MGTSITPITYALTTAQTEIWLAQQLYPDSPVYNIAQYTVIDGTIDTVVFEAALRQVIDEADTLRLQFVDSDDGLRQRIGTPAWSMPVLDLTAQADPEAAAQAWMQADYQQSVNLMQGPLFCYALLKVAPAQWIWYQRYHHIMTDGYGQYLIAQRVAHVYSALCAGTAPAACDFGSIRQLLESDAQYQTSAQREKDEAYWLKHCAHWPEPATLASRAAPALQQRLRQTTDLAIQWVDDYVLDAGRLAQFLSAALAAYVHRMTGVQDVVFGFPVTARLGEDRHIPGMVANTVPLRFRFEPEVNLLSLMRQAAKEIQSALQYQRYPSEALQCQLGLAPGQSLFGIKVNVMPFDYALSFAGHSSTNHNLLAGPVEDLMLGVYWTSNSRQLRIDFDANPACYTAEMLDTHQRRFIRFMQVLAADATQPISGIDLLDADERHRLLVEWNATKQDYPSHLCIHQLFEARVERTPEAPALVYEDQTFSYAQLNARANRLAHQLIELGVKPDARVVICVQRSPALVVGLLAILKAGGAYVPLDPNYPSERLAHILADAAPNIVLTDAAGRTALGEAALAECTVLDPTILPALPDTNPLVAALTARHLAYVIYTSGSTGMPKGVMVEHRGLSNYLSWAMRAYAPKEGAVVFSSLSFDATVTSLWTPLLYGSTVKLLSAVNEIEALEAYVRQAQSEGLVKITPVHLDILGQRLQQEGIRTRVAAFVIGGEALNASTVAMWQRIQPGVRLINEYGPTETIVGCAVYEASTPLPQSGSVPIGRPIANTRIYLLDAHDQPVPLGAVGELYIGGAGVTRGYLNRPALTAERFVPDPFSEEADARLYKTGDVARYLPDGNLEYLGRNDEQVKIRGFRIEPGEIEACLTAHPQVRDAVVVACGEGSAKRLVAYVQAEADEQLASTLRAQLAASLPEYMVPSAFVRLDAWPLTPNGKLDRRALPAPDDAALAHQAYEAPQGELETTLAMIWAELLDVKQVGRHDSFFALGGHSLLAVRLLNRVRMLGADVPLATLFATPTLTAFAAALEAHLQQGTDALPEITPVPREGSLPLSFAQQRLWFLAQLDGGSESYHVPLALHVRGSLDRVAWQQALDALLARHEALRSTFVSVEGQPQVRLLPADTGVPLRWHDLRGVPDALAQLARLSHEATHAPFVLACGPLIHACGIQVADDEHVMLLVQHHIVSDGWSIGVMVRELSTMYAASVGAQADPLPPLAVQYPDYAAWQRQWLTGERLQAQSDYWRATLADAPVLLELPTDRPRPAQQSFAGAQVPVRIDAATTQALKRLSAEHGTTLFMTVLAAWSAVLARLSGQDDLVIGTPSANRGHAAIEPLIGFFVNTLALRVDLSDEPNTSELLKRVRCATLDAQAHQDLPFEQVVEIVQPPRRLDHTPLFQVMLAWQNNAPGEWCLPGLTATPAELEHDVVKFDLELNLSEAGEEIIGSLGYATSLFERSTIERHVGYLQTMLRAMVAHPQQPVATLELLSPVERQLLLGMWNATQQAYPKHRCVHQLFEAQVERTPEATALVYEDQTLSYAQLNARANRLAHQLIELGVKPDMRVAICLQRSPALVVGLLAILKAGGAYVPLDPSYPGERLMHILVDAAPSIVLADAAGRAALGEAALAECTVLDPATPPALPDTNPSVAELKTRHLAYVIYTSGSTGTPKGVMVPHHAIARLVINNGYVDIRAGDRVAFAANPAFDASTFEVWAPLLNGATVVLFDRDAVLNPQRLEEALARYRVTTLFLTTVLFNQLVPLMAPALARLKYLLCGGEQENPERFAQLLKHDGPKHLIHCYGPTENTTFSTIYEVTELGDRSERLPIGRPIANTRVYLLDAHGQPVPLGAVGELYLGGAGVARGYLNRPELTAERFVPDPFSNDAGARLYKTGDVARYRPDGNLEFLGRNDEQVKLRGFRIEPGEIAACLTAHPQVRDAVVLALGEGNDKRLIAYVVAEADAALASTLRMHVAAALPEYMVPSAFVRLDAWPLTPNGKLDRRALPAPDDDALAHQAYEAPQGELETTLAEIWAELLGVERVGRHDSFFALGGHSLLAVRLMNQVRGLGADVPLATLFAKPTLAAFAAALEARLQQGTDTLPEITPVSREGSLPLSFAQQRLWFLAQLDGASESYHIPLALHVRGSLDRAAWQQALDALFARHEALRSTFVSVEGQPQVRLLPADTGVPLRWHDLRGVPDAQAQLARLSHEAAHAPFNLAQGPLIHACGIQVADDEHVMLLVQHHIVSDGWSIGVMVRELSTMYAASVGAQADPLPPLAVQYPDYAAWQRQWLTGERLQAQSDYWRATLADAPVLLELPTDRPRPAQQSFAGAQVPVHIDAATTQALKRLSAEHGTTLFMTVLAAWSAVLARLSGQDDLVIGTPSANRGHAAIEPLLGFFVNTLALRVDLSDEPNTSELLKRVRCTTLDAQAHQDLPFEQVVEIVQPPRRLDHTPLFQVMFAWQSNETGQWRLPGLDVKPGELDYNMVRFDLELHLYEAGEEIVGALCYASALFDPATIERYVGYLTTMLQAMVANPQQPVATLQILGADERQLLLQTWNATAAPYPTHQCIHQLFEAQVERSPNATALVYEAQTLSYAQLNARANCLAHRLIELGAKPDARVAICVERSPAMVVGLLAILKAGGACVPLDPAYPSERLAHILNDAAPTIVLADATGKATLGEAALACQTVLEPDGLLDQAAPNPRVAELASRHLAYVIYTSGSTGTPKGVMIEHGQIARLLEVTKPPGTLNEDQALIDRPRGYSLTSADRVLQKASFNFDVSIWELFWTLLNGATLVVADSDVHKDPVALMELIVRERITTVHFVPSMLSIFLDTEGVQRCTSVKHLICGGEALPGATVQQCQTLLPDAQVHNLYGPAENPIGTTFWTCSVACTEDNIPIGRPIANTRVYLLDAHGQPVPLGAVGELYIGGAGVARGYLNRPELTAERFVPDPFSDDAGARLYQSGDVARYRPDGNLEFLGRNDEQVKIRGFRIEPGEIEACLTAHPQVRDAVVLALGEGQNKRLVAYVVADPDDALASTLRAQVAVSLPEYMVPSAFVRLDAWPLTPNGKLDRRALPAPDDAALAHQAYEAPQGELETTLAMIWAELLDVKQVGRHDSFFALGGHSLLAVRLINRVRMLGADVPLATLFATPTLAAFAAALEAHWQQGPDALPEITPVSREGSLPLSFAQQRLWFLAQLDGVSESYHMPLALHVRGPLDRAAWQQALDALLARHEALRSTFVSVEGQPQVRLLPADAGVPLRWHDLRGMLDADVQLSRLSHEAAHAPFDLARGPLIRACGIQVADDEHVVLLTQHHIVSDGWSLGVLTRELSALYAANVGAQADPLPALTIQYPDYAAWQRQWLTGERLQVQSDYWRTTLADTPVLLELPTNRPRPAQQSFAGAHVPVRIDASTTQALKRLGAEHGTTLFMTVLAAWSAVLARLSGQQNLVIGTPSANRGHAAIEPLIGFFVNTLALRVDLSGEPNTNELLKRVRRTTLDAQAHQDLPFEQVVEIVQPPRRLNHTPLFQVMFAWQSNETGQWRLPGLDVKPGELDYNMVRFDLELHLYEAGEEIVGALCYASALFDPATIERYVGYLTTMLQAMVANPQQPVATLQILGADERQLLLQTWNATAAPYPTHQCIHQLFEAQVERSPNATALVYEAQTLSYAQLNARANCLAHRLIELGAKPDARVAICVERSPAMVVGLLAILKAGGACVPLDPAYPSERLAHILNDAAPTIVLADATGKATLGEAALACQTVLEPDGLLDQAAPNPRVAELASRHLAYVIYTSGSTGTPKGVMIEHGQIARLVEVIKSDGTFNEDQALIDRQRGYRLAPADRVLQKTPFNFDISIWELFWTLLNGATLVVADAGAHKDPVALKDLIVQERITTVYFVPSMLSIFLDTEGVQRCTSVKHVICSGEALPGATAQRCQTLLPDAQVHNLYGPTENAIGTTFWTCPVACTEGTISIGRPITNTQVYLLDACGQPVPLGAVGELYIGGAGVARGYWNRPALTAERFVPDPFSEDAGARLYKTGDVARYRPDGNLEYLGRNDDQVKIRGLRIEPGEIAACLTAHPQVRDAVVVATGEGSAKRLVAYVQAEADEQLASTLRAQVAASLPEYMVPSAFVRLDAWPLTPNGKLDRRALPVPSTDAFAHKAYEAPQGECETKLAAIWTKLLGVERIGRHDNFFDLGGHSLAAMKLIFQIQKIFNVQLSVQVLFDTRSVAKLAERIKSSAHAQTPAEKPIEIPHLMKVDAILAPEIRRQIPTSNISRTWKQVLLTGSTGFVGRYLLLELLQQTAAHIICLIKSEDKDQAMRRIVSVLHEIGHYDIDLRRISVLCGDLDQVNLGLTQVQLTQLANELDAIVHNGAIVNHFFSYRELRQANVLATNALIRIAATGKEKSLHYISTLAVAPWKGSGLFTEDGEISDVPVPNGYVQSKWVAEKLVGAAAKQGIPCGIYRLGQITADSVTGYCNIKDRIYRTIRAIAALGLVSDATETYPQTPVDYAARAIVKLAVHQAEHYQIAHIKGHQLIDLDEFVAQMRDYGINIDENKLTWQEWTRSLNSAAKKTLDDNLIALSSIFDTTLLPDSLEHKNGLADETIIWCAKKTNKRLSELDFCYPTLGPDYVKSIIRFILSQESGRRCWSDSATKR
ncbi:amino acid adenylation domain-containing protein (plasmid) [Mycetohabitans endofungorum]|uniref:amino acid adenylation domain-containing protein n=1 Tax=Mycetohabitans endofungorum TaxID=417203 RepID=UPI0030CF6FA3